MPIYEYRCQACGFEKEFLQKLSEAPITDCPSCGQSAMSKLISAAGFQLKGTGWYATDFKNSGSKPAKPDSQKGGNEGEKKESDGAKKDDTKSEGAPACGAGACPACQ
jgi:putative FmdB family regulatory protein